MRCTRNTLCAVVILFLLGAGSADRTTTPSLRSDSNLVLIPAIVTFSGQPLDGLTARDFVVLHDGRPEEVNVFESINADEQVTPEAVKAGTAQNFVEGGHGSDTYIVLLDFLNASHSTGARIQAFLPDVVQLFASKQSRMAVLLLTKDGLKQVHSLASTPQDFEYVVRQWTKRAPQRLRPELVPGVAPDVAPELSTNAFSPLTHTQATHLLETYADFEMRSGLDQSAMTRDALEQIARAFAGVPGRKKLIWMTTGFPRLLSGRVPAWEQSRVAEDENRALAALTTANIAIYAVDSNQVANPLWEEGLQPKSDVTMIPSLREVSTQLSSLMKAANSTGGLVCTSDPARCVGQAIHDAPHYYLLGFYLRGDIRPGWHELSVRVNRRGAKVRSRNGFVAERKPAPSSAGTLEVMPSEGAITRAIESPLDFSEIPLRVRWLSSSGDGPEATVGFDITSPPGGIAVNAADAFVSLDIVAVLIQTGASTGQSFPRKIRKKLSLVELQQFKSGGFRYRMYVPSNSGATLARLIVRDNASGAVGSVSLPIQQASAAPAN